MKLDTSSYYPKSSIDHSDYMPASERNKADVPDFGSDHDPLQEDSDMSDESSPQEPEIPTSDGPELPPTETETVITAFAHFLSWVFVPLLMPVYAAVLAFSYSVLAFTGLGTRLMFLLIILLVNVAIPSILVLALKKIGLVKDVGLNNQKERLIPYLAGIICLIGTAVFLGLKEAPSWIVMFYFGGAVAGVIEVIVNFWWKISVHAAGIAGIVALLTYLLISDFTLPGTQTWLLVSIGVAGLLGAARIWLGRHSLGQVLAGYAVGFGAVFLMMLV